MGGVTYLPLRFLAENLGYKVKFYSDTNAIHIYNTDVEPKIEGVNYNIPTFTLTEEVVRDAILDMKAEYPEGMHWTNDNVYNVGNYYYGGCAAFAEIVQDTVFKSLPSRDVKNFEELKAGDNIRIGDYHSVIVLENLGDSIKVVEGNYNSSIHWGRIITRTSLEKTGYKATTRYPL